MLNTLQKSWLKIPAGPNENIPMPTKNSSEPTAIISAEAIISNDLKMAYSNSDKHSFNPKGSK